MTWRTDAPLTQGYATHMNTITLPVQVAPGFPLRVRGPNDASGGWSVAKFDTLQDAQAFMRANPNAAMPAWRRFGV